ncbi:MAG: ECF transporter S component [Clostridia bacterium]|nr:ECF transporter S component [Clostridia bacterium]
MKKNSLKTMVFAALFAALTVVATCISIPLPGNGYANLGDCFVIISGALLGPYGVLAASLGSSIADVILGFTIYAPATFFIKGVMALVAFLISGRKQRKLLHFIIASVLCEIIMVGGYFVFEIPLYGIIPAAGNIIGNGMQALFGAVAAPIILTLLKKYGIINKIKGEL